MAGPGKPAQMTIILAVGRFSNEVMQIRRIQRVEEGCSYLPLVVNPFSDVNLIPLAAQIHLSDKSFSRSIGDRRELTKLELSLSHLFIGAVLLPISLLVTTAIVFSWASAVAYFRRKLIIWCQDDPEQEQCFAGIAFVLSITAHTCKNVSREVQNRDRLLPRGDSCRSSWLAWRIDVN